MCVQEPCVYLLSAASIVIRNMYCVLPLSVPVSHPRAGLCSLVHMCPVAELCSLGKLSLVLELCVIVSCMRLCPWSCICVSL